MECLMTEHQLDWDGLIFLKMYGSCQFRFFWTNHKYIQAFIFVDVVDLFEIIRQILGNWWKLFVTNYLLCGFKRESFVTRK